MVQRLQVAHTNLELARDARKAHDEATAEGLLDDAVLYAWRFAEYAVNVVLELASEKQERSHKHAERVEDLRAKGWLKGDYSKRLENLRLHRLKADYAGYSSAPSVHYSPADFENCLTAMDELMAEVLEHLRREKKLP